MKTFNVTREDNCIWVEDLRRTADPELKADSVTHITPSQAVELVKSLSEVVVVELSAKEG